MNTKDPIELLAVNARLVSKQHPETFKLFSEEHLNHINSGDSVKIIHNGERFWFEVDYQCVKCAPERCICTALEMIKIF